MTTIVSDSGHSAARKPAKIGLALGAEALHHAPKAAPTALSKLGTKALAALPVAGEAAALAVAAWDAKDCFEARASGASAGKVAAACIAMAGSAAVATQIPIVAQVGLGVSILATIVEPEH